MIPAAASGFVRRTRTGATGMIAGMSEPPRTRRHNMPGGERNRWAFTLIELLVVVAIIGLLISISTPAISAARRVSRRTVCGTNLHSIGLALQAYLQTNNEYYPDIADWPPDEEKDSEYGLKWKPRPPMYRLLNKELSLNMRPPITKTTPPGTPPLPEETEPIMHFEVFRCPADRDLGTDSADIEAQLAGRSYWETGGTSYSWNTTLSRYRVGKDWMTRKKYLGGFDQKPAQTPLFFDSKPFHHKNPDAVGSVMYLYLDYHVAPDNYDARNAVPE